MNQHKKYYMTPEGVKKLEDEVEYYKTVKRKEVTEKIKIALSFGDLSENAEYDEAKNDQAFVEGKIAQLEAMLRNAVIIDESQIDNETVNMGCKVKVKDYDFDEEVIFKIVGSTEADPMEYKISNESPVGEALMGKRVGETIEVPIPDGISKYEILEITR
ncbi:transcription elongation factor GreA [Oceanirhabdus seepicola]|uniref:Transcription elongation factor GreA n=1 Tax=Oceanirhabdus seepicola TaxID=2828781 RepID=A0A9J6P975_9CLOT|nr:transcription elongation factor GreA [Oceanirhabdus seepicola]MCM1992037.1 transcription elongation factor GreA [Oceanirhabdus seepicola]